MYIHTVNETHSYMGGCFNGNLDFAIINTNDKVGMLDISTSPCTFESDIGLPSNAIARSCTGTRNVIVGTFTDDSLQGDIWFTHLNLDDSDETNKVACCLNQKKLHSKPISCAILSNSQLFTASDDGSLCICDLSENIVEDTNAMNKYEASPLIFEDILVPEKDLEEKENRIKDLRLEVRSHLKKKKTKIGFNDMKSYSLILIDHLHLFILYYLLPSSQD